MVQRNPSAARQAVSHILFPTWHAKNGWEVAREDCNTVVMKECLALWGFPFSHWVSYILTSAPWHNFNLPKPSFAAAFLPCPAPNLHTKWWKCTISKIQSHQAYVHCCVSFFLYKGNMAWHLTCQLYFIYIKADLRTSTTFKSTTKDWITLLYTKRLKLEIDFGVTWALLFSWIR